MNPKFSNKTDNNFTYQIKEENALMDLVNLKKVTDEQRVREYMDEVFAMIKQRDPHEQEFLQAVKEIFSSLIPVFEKHPKYMENGILRSEEHTSELQSRGHLVCRLLLEKKQPCHVHH